MTEEEPQPDDEPLAKAIHRGEQDNPEYGGADLDAAIETAIEARGATEVLRRMDVELDSIADTLDFPGHLISDTRGIQMDVRTLADEYEELAEAQYERADHIRENLYGGE